MSTGIAALDLLFEEARKYSASDEIKELLEFFRKFRHMSVYNAMLIKIQRPGCGFAATASDWMKRFNREVKPEANPMVILKPFGPVAFVYDLLDTFGEEVPDHILNPFECDGEINYRYFDNIILSMNAIGIDFTEQEHGSQSGGYIMKVDEGTVIELYYKGKEHLIKRGFSLVVNDSLSPTAMFATIVHELGHYFCGHLEDRKKLEKNQKEFEAECISFLVCDRLNVKSNSKSYLWAYLHKNKQIPQISMDRILKAVGKIETMYKSVQKPKNEMLLS